MTDLTRNVSRHVGGRHYDLVVTLAPEGLYLREKGRRFTVGPLDYGRIYQRGAAEQVARDKAERKRLRKAERAALAR